MQEKILKINSNLEISAAEFSDGINIYITEYGRQVCLMLSEWEKMIAWWEKTYPEMLREKLEEE